MEKEKTNASAKSINWIMIACMLSLIVMLMTVVGSMFYFQQKMKEGQSLISSSEYRNFDSYYVLITENQNSSFWQNVYLGAKEEAAKNGAYVELLGENLNDKYDKFQLMQIAIDSKVDGIIVEASEEVRMTQLITKAERKGIPVITVLSDNTNGGRQSFVGISLYNLGREYGKQVSQIMTEKKLLEREEPTEVLVLLSDDNNISGQTTILTTIREIIRSELKEDINIVQKENSDDKTEEDAQVYIETTTISDKSAFSAEETIRDIFISGEKLPDVIICLNEQHTTCAYQAVIDHNKVGEIEVLGYYESDTIFSAIQKGIIRATVIVDTNQMGQYCVSALDEFRQSGYVSDYFSVDTSLLDANNIQGTRGSVK